MIGPEHGFVVSIDGSEISVSDRDYFSNIEYLWSLGDVGDIYAGRCVNAKKKETITGSVSATRMGRDRMGRHRRRAAEHRRRDERRAPSWHAGKLIHEDLLALVKQAGVFAKYLMGEIHADFVDSDDDPDIATSDRQSLKEDDPRFEALTQYLAKTVLLEVGNKWRDWRRATTPSTRPARMPWSRSGTPHSGRTRRPTPNASSGTLGSIALEREADRLELYKHGILAFERLRLRDLLSEVDKLDETALQFDVIGKAFATIDDIEAAEYGQIAKGRVSVISSFADLVDADAKEKVIQTHLFDHLWLLDTSWERASTNERIEESVRKEFDEIDAGLSPEEKAGRARYSLPDRCGQEHHHRAEALQRYRHDGRFGRGQIGKYRVVLQKCLAESFPDEPHEIECIAVLGKPPSDLKPEEVTATLAGINTRVVTYDTLIANAKRSYQGLPREAQGGITPG